MAILNIRRVLIFVFLLIIVPLELYFKAYTGIAQNWVRDYSGDILYEILWCLVAFWFVHPVKDLKILKNITGKIALWIFAITCVIEIS